MDLERMINERDKLRRGRRGVGDDHGEVGDVMTKDWVVFDDEFTEAKHSYP